MSTIVFQEFKSCYESQVTEPCSLSLKLNSPKLEFSPYLEVPKKSSVSDSSTCTWSCIQALCYSSSNGVTETKEKPEVYAPPVLVLSEKSLEMCTENLGSETGTDITEFSVFTSATSLEKSERPTAREMRKSRQKVEIKRAHHRDFPPPLTTISGSNLIRIKPHRESGRLVIKAFSAPARHSCIQAERRDGRLRLSIFRDNNSDIDSEEKEEVVSDCEVEENDEYEYQLSEDEDINIEEEEEADAGEGEGEYRENVEGEGGEQQEESDGVCLGNDTDGINWDVGVKLGMGEFQTPSRCKEDGRRIRRLINWEALWVATS
ncbi:hypothetical protein Ancab_030415 [Ancistrocladus abbreviatus]